MDGAVEPLPAHGITATVPGNSHALVEAWRATMASYAAARDRHAADCTRGSGGDGGGGSGGDGGGGGGGDGAAACAGCEAIRPVIVATGPLTNVALFLSLFPDAAAEHLSRIVVMGGAIGVGNIRPLAEFNFLADPEAASRVLSSGVPVSIVPLNVTHTALADEAVLARIAALGTPFSRWLVALLTFFERTYRDVFGFAHPPLHDPCAVLLAARPALFETRHLRVDIETAGALTAGAAVIDVYGSSDKPRNAIVAEKMDVPAFWDVMIEAIARADAVSPINKGATQ
jgi:hypothetical protein